MQRLLVCCVFLFLVYPAGAKDRGSPPAGGEALFRWCRYRVITRHGSPTPGIPNQPVIPATQGVAMTDACVQARGKGY
jgi:hypothetical protein